MGQEFSEPKESDLDRTDNLPILKDVALGPDDEDDPESVELPASEAESRDTAPVIQPIPPKPAFTRPAAVDLSVLAQTIRSVEERIAQQNSEFVTMSRAYERSRDSEAEAVSRANSLGAELALARSALEAERERLRESDRLLLDKDNLLEIARTRGEDAAREAARFREDMQTLTETLAARDLTISQVLHSMAERDAQLVELQREQASLVPALAASTKHGTQLATDLEAAREKIQAIELELRQRNESLATFKARLDRTEKELGAARHEARVVGEQSTAYLEALQTHEWRRSYLQSQTSDADASPGLSRAIAEAAALGAQRNELNLKVAELGAQLAAKDQALEALNAALDAQREELNRQVAGLSAEVAAKEQSIEAQNAALEARIAAIEKDHADQMATARAALGEELRQANEALSAAERRAAAQATQITKLETEAETAREEMVVLITHLQAARRPVQLIEADLKRLNEELAEKTARLEELTAANRQLQSAVERTRGALEEREFLIRRLERSEINNANALGRLQTTIERLSNASASNPPAPVSPFVAPASAGRPPAAELKSRAKVPSAGKIEPPAAVEYEDEAELDEDSVDADDLEDVEDEAELGTETSPGVGSKSGNESDAETLLARAAFAAGAREGEPGHGSAPAAAATATPPERFFKLIRVDSGSNFVYTLARRTQIGRMPGCDLQLESSAVSRHHAMILTSNSGAIVEDLNSTNGIFVNGVKVRRQMLRDGDVLTVGEAHFRFEAIPPSVEGARGEDD